MKCRDSAILRASDDSGKVSSRLGSGVWGVARERWGFSNYRRTHTDQMALDDAGFGQWADGGKMGRIERVELEGMRLRSKTDLNGPSHS